MPEPRYVTLRHAVSGRWCIEAPHPNAGIPQPYYLEGVPMGFNTLSGAVASLERNGYVVVRSTKTKTHHVYRNGKPLIAA